MATFLTKEYKARKNGRCTRYLDMNVDVERLVLNPTFPNPIDISTKRVKEDFKRILRHHYRQQICGNSPLRK